MSIFELDILIEEGNQVTDANAYTKEEGDPILILHLLKAIQKRILFDYSYALKIVFLNNALVFYKNNIYYIFLESENNTIKLILFDYL